MDRIFQRQLQLLALAFVLVVLSGEVVRAQDDSTDQQETAWTLSAHTRYQNKDNSGGVDMSNDLATLQYGIRLEHSSGASLDVRAANLLGSGGGFERWGVTLGYNFAATTWLTLNGEISQFKYQNDSLNAIANLTNSFTLGATFPNNLVNVGLSYNSYFGGGSANYFGLNLDRTFQNEDEDLTINPSLNLSFISQTIDEKRLVSYKKNLHALGKGAGKGSTTTSTSSTSVTVTGLSGVTLAVSVSYDLGGGFTVSAVPVYVYSPKAELAAYTNEFLWSVGLSYSMGF